MNQDDEMVARGSHTKYVALAWKDDRNITDELKPEISETQRRANAEKKPSISHQVKD